MSSAVSTLPRPPTGSRSLAYRLARAHGVALFLLCALLSYLLDRAAIHGIEEGLALEVSAEARLLAAIIAERRDPAGALREHLGHVAEARGRPRFVLRVGRAGATIAQSPGAERVIPASPETYRWPYRREDVRGADGQPYKIEVCGDLAEIDVFIRRFRWSLVTLVGPLLVAAIAAAYWVVGRTLRPLERITAAAAGIGSQTLGERLDPGAAPDEIERLARSFNDMLDRLEDAFRRLEEFGADLAHEVRTPLQNIRGEAEVALLKPRTAAEYRDILGEMLEECDRLSRIVDDVLLLSRVERHEEALERAHFDLAREVEEVREYFAGIAEARGVALAARAEPGAIAIRGDRLKLRRALANLVDNAIKYTEAGGRVTIEARAGPGGAEVTVADTGKGIAPEHLPRLFQRFYRVEKSRSRQFGGSGLGLGIARTLVRAHGGDVTIESEPGKGTRATVRLPRPDLPQR